MRGALVVTQVAMTTVCLITAGLFVRGLTLANEMELGFSDPDRLLVVTTDLHAAGYSAKSGRPILDQVLARARGLPGVRHASWTTLTPLGFAPIASAPVEVPGYSPPSGESMDVVAGLVGDDYFETFGTRIRSGRGIRSSDQPTSDRVVVISNAFASRFFPDTDPLGRVIRHEGEELRVVGVAEDIKVSRLTEPPVPLLYLPLAQNPVSRITLALRSEQDPEALLEPARKAFASVDASVPIVMPERCASRCSQPRSVNGSGVGC